MAVVNAANTGNWSNSSTWPGGVFPTSADDVYANGKTVTIDQSISVVSLNTTAGTGGVDGGGFTLSAGNTVTCSGDIVAGTSTCISYTYSRPSTATVVAANIRGSTITSTRRGIFSSSSGGLVVTGNVIGGASTNSNGIVFSGDLTLTGDLSTNSNVPALVFGSSSKTVVINGNITATGTGSAVSVIDVDSGSGTLTINGNLTGSTYNAANCLLISTTGYTVTVNGNLTASSGGIIGTSSACIRISEGTTLTVNGNISGGSGQSSCGIIFVGTGTGHVITVNGTCTGGTGSPSSSAISMGNGTGTVALNGPVIGKGSPAVVDGNNPGSPLFSVTGPIQQFSSTSCWPLAVSNWNLTHTSSAENYMEVYDTSNTMRTLHTDDFATDLPLEEDVRAGVVFGGSDVGTLEVPLPSQVSLGIPTDDTVGTGVVNAEDVWNVDRADLTTTGSIGERVKNVSTVDSTGDQLTAIID